MKVRRIALVVILVLAMALGLSACGKKAVVSINDRGSITEIEVKLPDTVENILAAAEIQLKDGDQVSPDLSTKMSDPKEIVISRKNVVKLTVNGETKEVEMIGGTINDLLKKEGITLGEKQKINHEMTEYLTDGMEVKIYALSKVTIKVDGNTVTKDVEGVTVEDAIKEAGLTIGTDDKVTPDLTSEVKDGLEITIDRVKTETVKETEVIEYEVVYEYDGTMASGYEETRVAGVNGEKEVTYKVSYVNGEEDSREVVEEKIISEPTNAVVVIGTYEAPAPSEPEAPSNSGGSESDGRTVLYEVDCPNCSGDGHGYREVHYSDGTVEYQEY